MHQCALENARLQDITAEKGRLRERLSESEELFRVLEADFTQYKQVARGTPEMELRDQVRELLHKNEDSSIENEDSSMILQ